MEHKGESAGSKTAILVVANVIPLGALGAFLVLWHRGEVTLKPLPPGSVSILALLGGALVAIVLLAWAAHPLLRGARARVHAGMRVSEKRLREGGLLSSLIHGSIYAGQSVIAFVLWVDLLLLGLLIVGLLLAEAGLLIRFVTNLRG